MNHWMPRKCNDEERARNMYEKTVYLMSDRSLYP
jgi:hypothetical protein